MRRLCALSLALLLLAAGCSAPGARDEAAPSFDLRALEKASPSPGASLPKLSLFGSHAEEAQPEDEPAGGEPAAGKSAGGALAGGALTGGAPTGDAPASGTGTAASNNGGLYVKWGGMTFFREYNADCYEPTGLWDDFTQVPCAAKTMVCRSLDGRTERLFSDDGTGPIYIDAQGNFYLYRLYRDLNGIGETYQAYSLDRDGNLRWESRDDTGRIFAFDEQRGILVCEVNGAGGLRSVNCETGEWLDIGEVDALPLFYDIEAGVIYYQVASPEAADACEMIIASSDWKGDIHELVLRATYGELMGEDIDWMMWERLSVKNLYRDGDFVWAFFVHHGGTGAMYTQSMLIAIDRDGSWVSEPASPAQFFGIHRPFSFVQEDSPFYDAEKPGFYLCNSYYTTYLLPEDDAFGREILSADDMMEAGYSHPFDYGEEAMHAFRDVEYVDTDVWFSVVTGVRNEAEDIGWRYAYTRTATYLFCKDAGSGEIELIHQF